MLPGQISDWFAVCNNVKCLRGTDKLIVPPKKTRNIGSKSTTFIGTKEWNSLLDEWHSMTILKEFKNAVKELHL